jgi:branched-chain amino acid transport system substrate-binding protein
MGFIGARRAAVVCTAVLASAALTACQGSSGPGGGSTRGDIQIAMTGPLTGDNAQYGTDQIDGMQLAVDQFNDSGGAPDGPNQGRTLSLSSHDDAADPNQGAAVAQQLCDDSDVMAVLGPVNSSVALAVGPIYQRCGLTEIISYASNPKITTAGYENVFRSIPNDDQLSAADVAAAVQIAGARNLAVVYANDDYGTGLFTGVQAAAEKYGATIVAAESFTSGATRDFSSILTNIRGSSPDALLIMTTYSDAGLLTNQARQVGITSRIVVASGSNTPQFLELAGPAAEGVLTPVLFDPASDEPRIQQFVSDFRAKYHRDPGESSATGYASVQLVQHALRAGATTRKEMSEKLSEGKGMDTLFGPLTFDDNRDPSSLGSLTIVTVRDGAFVPNDEQLTG